jgi:cell division protease FtsH
MATETLPAAATPVKPESRELVDQWRRFTRFATATAVIASPAVFVWYHSEVGLSVGWSVVATFFSVIAFRGVFDVATRRLIPWPSLFGLEDVRVTQEDVIARRRAWFWRFWLKLAVWYEVIITTIWVIRELRGDDVSWWSIETGGVSAFGSVLSNPSVLIQVAFVGFLFLANFLIFLGPLMLVGILQIKAFEPGDADWGVRLEDVRGQDEAKEEVRRVVTLWQSGDAFEKAGGKRERGLLLLGAPGTGKTMLSKAIATGFNCPFVSIPGSGFAQTFIGIDAAIVRFLSFRAKRLARKWGGQCIVFIDEIDAVGMRRSSLGGQGFFQPLPSFPIPAGDVIMENQEWRDQVFAERAADRPSPVPMRIGNAVNRVFPGMFGGGGQLALNQLLVVMDGIGNPPFLRKMLTNRMNTFLDATYVIPPRIGRVPLRVRRPRPRHEQIYFIGACNVPLETLDPALTRPGRMGRHVWFRTPTKDDRKDIFDLYLGKVAHEDDLETDDRKDELARVTNGYSPAMIEQVCSMGLMRAHFDGRERCSREDIVESLTTVESGTAINIEYVPEETLATAIHEAGHAAASHVYNLGYESTRLSVRMRGSSLGHFQSAQKEEKFGKWRHEMVARLIVLLGAMAAERVFYGENTNGVGGDVQMVTAEVGRMVGQAAMGPEEPDLPAWLTEDERDAQIERIMNRYERIGSQIMNRARGGSAMESDPLSAALSDPAKRKMAAQLLGQAYVTAHHLVRENRDAVEQIANVLVERREMYGDEVVTLLDGANLQRPEFDPLREELWPAA